MDDWSWVLLFCGDRIRESKLDEDAQWPLGKSASTPARLTPWPQPLRPLSFYIVFLSFHPAQLDHHSIFFFSKLMSSLCHAITGNILRE